MSMHATGKKPAPVDVDRVRTEIKRLFSLSRSRVWPRGLTFNSKGTKKMLTDLQRIATGPGKFLDLGCGPEARHKAYVEAHGFEWFGVDFMDLDPPFENYVKMQNDCIGFGDSTFDVVGLYNVIEHFANPEKMFGEIRRVLKPDGIVCGASAFWEPEHHSYYHLTHRGLTSLFNRFGMEMIYLEPTAYTGSVLASQRFFGGNGRLAPRPLRKRLKSYLVCNLNWIPFLTINVLELLRKKVFNRSVSPFHDCASIYFYARKCSVENEV